MSFKTYVGGVEIVCDTLDELKDVIREFGEETAAKSARPKAPKAAKVTKAPAQPESDRPAKPKPPVKPAGGLADSTYLKHSWRIVRILLREDHEVGRLTTSLRDELEVGDYMIRRILDRLASEKPPFLHVQRLSRGKASYVRLTDIKVAEGFATAQEQLYKEQLSAELAKV